MWFYHKLLKMSLMRFLYKFVDFITSANISHTNSTTNLALSGWISLSLAAEVKVASMISLNP